MATLFRGVVRGLAVDSHMLSGAYAVDAVSSLEQVLVKRHLASCGPCQSEVGSLREAAGRLSAISATDPPANLSATILTSARATGRHCRILAFVAPRSQR